ncbi:MAG: hypothetical protein WBC73_01460 [Phormidesmis sp.]
MDRPAKSFLESLLTPDPQKTIAPLKTAKAAVVRKAEAVQKAKVQRVHCPTCGSSAERHHQIEDGTVSTQCSHCDYLLTICINTGRVIESYAPSFSPAAFAAFPTAS